MTVIESFNKGLGGVRVDHSNLSNEYGVYELNLRAIKELFRFVPKAIVCLLNQQNEVTHKFLSLQEINDHILSTLVTIRYDLIDSHKAKIKKHPMEQMKSLGCKVLAYGDGSIGDCVFIGIDKLPVPFPKYIDPSGYKFHDDELIKE